MCIRDRYYSMMSGSIAGMTFWSCIYPIDVVKTRIQTAYIPSSSSSYSSSSSSTSFIKNITNIIKKEGIKTLYTGMSVSILRAIPTNAVIFGVYEYIYRKLKN